MHRRERDVDRVELIVAGSRRDDPAARVHDADHAKRLIPQDDVLADGIRVAEQLFGGDRAEDGYLTGACLLAGAEEAAAPERPRTADQRQLKVGAVEAREPTLRSGFGMDVLMHAFSN